MRDADEHHETGTYTSGGGRGIVDDRHDRGFVDSLNEGTHMTMVPHSSGRMK